jgi:hypothetical protein
VVNPCSVYAVTQDRLDDLLVEYAQAQADFAEASDRLELVKQDLLHTMEEEQEKTHEVQEGGKIYRATYYQGVRTEIDEKGLREELGDEVVDSYCKKVLDTKALETAMESGYVSPFAVGKHVTERKNRASVRFSTRAAEDA